MKTPTPIEVAARREKRLTAEFVAAVIADLEAEKRRSERVVAYSSATRRVRRRRSK